jgi:RHH-type transcriptional regulator, proline utilization regulon repressor / proline dehydrogenase / delta 1-pyrroline-5-carboxylate dehydrogenase
MVDFPDDPAVMPTPSPASPAAATTGNGIITAELPAPPAALRAAITAAWLCDETEHVRESLEQARLPAEEQARAQALAADLVQRVRGHAQNQGAIEAFMRQYDLGSEEGVLLMCVAEALLRIPDQETADKLIRDKLGDADWKKHMGESDSVLVNASTWGLMLTGRLVQLNDLTRADVRSAFKRLVGRVGEPVIRLAVRQAMRIMGHQFVMGRTIAEALNRSRKGANAAYRYSFDMLGEGALTAQDAARYLDAYRKAIHAIGQHASPHRQGDAQGPSADVFAAPSISIKLSALHPRYEHAKRARVMGELAPAILELAQLAKSYGIGFTIDAEEADRLELSLDLIEKTFSDPSLDGWEGYGLAVQAYQKRSPYVIDFLADLARRVGRRMPVRLVKGAYWDAEIKRAQIEGHAGYPPTWPTPGGCSRTSMRCTRCSQPTMRRRLRRSTSFPFSPREKEKLRSSSRSCTAWATTCTRKSFRPSGSTSHAGSTPRSVRTRICCHTWSAGCWKTAPIPASSTASPTRTWPSKT